MILAGGVGHAVEGPAVGQAHLDRPRGQGLAVLVAGVKITLDRLAAIDHRLLEVESQADRLELVRLDLETPGEDALARLGYGDAIGTERAPESIGSDSWNVPKSESVTGRATISRPRLSATSKR